jgi:hypothetical protein
MNIAFSSPISMPLETPIQRDDEKISFFSDFVSSLQLVMVGDGDRVQATLLRIEDEVFWCY